MEYSRQLMMLAVRNDGIPYFFVGMSIRILGGTTTFICMIIIAVRRAECARAGDRD
jgi:hypothetical protein